ncbi:helix-turn-helix domain-containing protein [Ruegeria arenilitoris]|uniref:helix-turn-helix domain-containing protein n=1 Tax=Ruegeria arenilitoris TaxID=1173585 RepID=UPI00147CB9E4
MAGAVRTEAYQFLLSELVRLRQEAGLSQAGLAKLLGKPPSYVGKYELAERRLDIVETIVILKVLKADVLAITSAVSVMVPVSLR